MLFCEGNRLIRHGYGASFSRRPKITSFSILLLNLIFLCLLLDFISRRSARFALYAVPCSPQILMFKPGGRDFSLVSASIGVWRHAASDL